MNEVESEAGFDFLKVEKEIACLGAVIEENDKVLGKGQPFGASSLIFPQRNWRICWAASRITCLKCRAI